jgi:hypothetical protein
LGSPTDAATPPLPIPGLSIEPDAERIRYYRALWEQES